MSQLTIRPAGPADISLVFTLLHELAAYEKLLDRFDLTEAAVLRDMLGPDAVCHCALAFEGEAPAGLVTWFWTYKSFRARRGLYLEDLFVRPQFRGRGHGRTLLSWLAGQVAGVGGCCMEWQVLDWNRPSIDFYDRLGGKPLQEWITYRLDGEALNKLAQA